MLKFVKKSQHPRTVITFHDNYIYDLNRYEDAINKYDSVMKTEPEVPIYATRAKERICHCLSKVILLLFPSVTLFNTKKEKQKKPHPTTYMNFVLLSPL